MINHDKISRFYDGRSPKITKCHEKSCFKMVVIKITKSHQGVFFIYVRGAGKPELGPYWCVVTQPMHRCAKLSEIISRDF